MNKRTKIASSLVLMGLIAPTFAQDAVPTTQDSLALEEITVIGSRRAGGGTNLDTAVPVDVLSGDDLLSVASGDLQDVLQTLAPSYNVAESPVDDGGTSVRTPTVRGLPGGEVLVLLNGKRIHKSAFISLSGDQDNKVGSHAVDISQYPAISAQRIEVLRDGAAAQYGSDAIAGVINIALKETTGFEGYVQAGQTYEGDGDDIQVGLNAGFALGDRGFANFTLELLDSDPTDRGVQRGDAQALIDNPATLIAAGGNPDAIPRPAQIQGKPNQEWTRFVYNIGYDISENTQLYAFGNYGSSEQDGDFFYRNPLTHSTFGTSAIDPTFNTRSIFPGGFTPRFNAEVDDLSINIGLKGEFANGMTWDISATTGESEIQYDITETVNASLGAANPASFFLGTLTNEETHINADFVYALENSTFASPISFAFGAEYRDESYAIGAGEPDSFRAGPLTDLPIGTSGFSGFSPAAAGENSRSNTALYLDIETDVTEKLQLGVAFRAEDYDDFGSTFDAKISGRYDFTDNFAIRSAFSTGFKAPTVGQVNLTSQNTNFDNGMLVVNGILPANNPLAQRFGAVPLEPEESDSFSAGFVYQGDNGLSLALDFYRIDLQDRLGLSQSFGLSAGDIAAFPTNFRAVRFFANGYDSESTGIDLVLGYNTEIGDGNLKLTAAINQNEVDVSNIALFGPAGAQSGLIGQRAVFNIENQVPETKGNITVKYDQGALSFFTRARYFGDWSFAEGGDPFAAPSNGGAVRTSATVFIDAALTYTFSDHFSVTVGADNLFDEQGDEYYSVANGNGPDCCGRVYSNASPYAFDGGLYYIRTNFNF